MIIKIVELGKAVEEVAIDATVATISEVFETAGRGSDLGAKVNGVDVASTTRVYDGDVVFLNAKKIKGNTDFIEVKFIQFGAGSGITSIAVEPGTSINDAAAAASKNYDGSEFRVNNDTTATDGDKALYSDARVFVSKKVKGNDDYIEVKFIQFGAGSGITSIAVTPGTTINEAAEAAGKNYEGSEFRVNNDTTATDGSSALRSDARVFVSKKVKGND